MTKSFDVEDEDGKMKPLCASAKNKKHWIEIAHESIVKRKRRVSGSINVFEGMLLWGKPSALRFPQKDRKHYGGSTAFNKIGPVHLEGTCAPMHQSSNRNSNIC